MIPAGAMNPRAVASLPACSLYPLQGSLMLLDAHLVFQPLLAALGVSPHQVAHGTYTHAHATHYNDSNTQLYFQLYFLLQRKKKFLVMSIINKQYFSNYQKLFLKF